jgi:hypothetical protein
MTKRSVPIQVLTIVPSLPPAPYWVAGGGRPRSGLTIDQPMIAAGSGEPVGNAWRYPSGHAAGRAVGCAGEQHGPDDARGFGGLRQYRDLDRAARQNAALPGSGAVAMGAGQRMMAPRASSLRKRMSP